MAIVQFAGYAAFILASLVLGTRLIWLWRRTREWPELTIGVSFWLGGGLGYTAWLVIGVLVAGDAPREAIKQAATLGLLFTLLGALCNGVGTALIFRAGSRWAWSFVASAGAVMLGSWCLYVSIPAGESTPQFWSTVLTVAPIYVWSAAEAISLGRTLGKRARLGLSDPLVANRTLLFGICSAAVVASLSISYAARLVYGLVTPPAWAATVASGALLIGAGAIWLGFFPPAFHRARVERALGRD